MELKVRANALDLPRRVIVPANAVNTYDLPVAAAEKIGALPHDGDLLHALFLYQMALNQIEVVREITLTPRGSEAEYAPDRAEYTR